jgi:hypothetical protein
MKLFILADGTWLSDVSDLQSNIYKLKIVLDKQQDCKVIYQPGIGTDCKSKFNSINLINGGLGLEIDNKIKGLYKQLITVYQPGDTLHFIGYSRGAYTVRCLAGLIYNVGLPNCNQLISNKLKSNNGNINIDLNMFINRAYSIYRSRGTYFHPDSEVSISFRNCWSTELEIPVDLLFCFETVGTLGVPPIPAFNLPAHYKFFNTNVNKNIKSAIHLLAKHEDRVIFNPTLMSKSNTNKYTILEEYIYSGDHSTLGGIDLINTGLNKLPLNYLYKRLGLPYDEPNQFDFIKPSFNWFDLLCFFVGGYKTRDLT